MDNVVDIQARISQRRQGRQVRQYREKILALQKVLQCASCHFKCAMCGHHLNETADGSSIEPGPLGYVFCKSCKGEFEDFLAITSGDKNPEVFWHNKAWLEMWSAWLDYQQAIQQFMRSAEFKLLLSEIEK